MTALLGDEPKTSISGSVTSPGAPRPAAVVAIAASAGGIKALSTVLAGLPGELNAAVLVVQHLAPHHRSRLHEILAKGTELTVSEAAQGAPLRAHHVYVAPPDHHLLVGPDWVVLLTETPLVHFVRPSADLLFESLAAHVKQRGLAVVLTGSGTDGAAGLAPVKASGGSVIVQDKGTSEFFGMPGAAIETGLSDRVLPLGQIPTAISDFVAASTR